MRHSARGTLWPLLMRRTIIGCTSFVMYTLCVPSLSFFNWSVLRLSSGFLGSDETNDRRRCPSRDAHVGAADVVYMFGPWTQAAPSVHAVRHRRAVAAPSTAAERRHAVDYGGIFPCQRAFVLFACVVSKLTFAIGLGVCFAGGGQTVRSCVFDAQGCAFAGGVVYPPERYPMSV